MLCRKTARTERKREVDQKGLGLSRRRLLAGAAGVAAVATLNPVLAQEDSIQDTVRQMGAGADELGERSPYEELTRMPLAEYPNGAFVSFTPLADLNGIITPSDLHHEVHHAGVPQIDPAEYRLLVHGMVDHPTVFTLDDLKRLPSASRIGFLECGGNSLFHLLGPSEDDTAQFVAGQASCSEWVGVPLTTLMRQVGVQPGATWALFEGGDAGLMARSWPVEKLWYGEGLLAYGQNGEALRPPQGYPVRLYVPGTEGNTNVKWLRRIEFSDQPWHTQKETAEYTDIRCDADGECVVNQFTFTMDAKSVITWPSGGHQIAEPGRWEIRGLAWSGRGAIERVEISTDSGQTWHMASLDQPVLPKAFTHFRYPWTWDGAQTTIMSRAVDSTGYVQPFREELLAWRGDPLTIYHSNAIFRWKVAGDGQVTSGDAI